jgi:hypothetical protein
MDVDIRKPASHDFGIRRPGMSGTTTTSDDEDDEDDLDSDEEDQVAAASGQPGPSRPTGRPNGQNGDSRTDVEGQTMDLPTAVDEAFPIYDSDEEYDHDYELEEARRAGGWHYYHTLITTKGREFGHKAVDVLKYAIPAPRSTQVDRSARQHMLFGDDAIQTKKFKAPKGKKIYVPVRVEPKVYFAAERTFLGWVSEAYYSSVPSRHLLTLCSLSFPSTSVPLLSHS